MSKTSDKPLILSIDDDPDIRRLLEQILVNAGYEVITAEGGKEAINLVRTLKPDLILLDVVMPDMDGYETCSKLRENIDTAYVPVIFLTALEKEQDRAKAFAVGASDYITKPIDKKTLLDKVKGHITSENRWREFERRLSASEFLPTPDDFVKFKSFLVEELRLNDTLTEKLSDIKPDDIFHAFSKEGIKSSQIAKLMAKFFNIGYMPIIDSERVMLGVFPLPFSKNNLVVPIGEKDRVHSFVLSNPFKWDLFEVLRKYTKSPNIKFFITEPENIQAILEYGSLETAKKSSKLEDKIKIAPPAEKRFEKSVEDEIEQRPVVHITNTILYTAVTERASDIHIEPKENHTLVRFRIDGDMRDMFSFNNTTGIMVLTRLKALAGLDITEKRKPQDGALEAIIDNRRFKLRLATTSTPDGESVIIRLLEPDVKQRDLKELGMADKQVAIMSEFATRTQGLILIVGPTGSGKTTTIYSFLAQIDCKKRSLISVEDPVEYRIPHANQQQVNEKMGVTFEALLKSSVRQDPDILFIGEIRDPYSAKVAVDFASTGHITITTLHTSNATTAIFRLERLGITRGQMADTIIGIVAQRLLKKLCPFCKKVVPISDADIEMLSPFTKDLPKEVAYPVGCLRCNETGYLGRESLNEIIKFDQEVSNMVRSNRSISEIRDFLRRRGDYLMCDHAIDKVRALIFCPKDVYEKVLIEETFRAEDAKEEMGEEGEGTLPLSSVSPPTDESLQIRREAKPIPPVEEKSDKRLSILIVEDDKDTQSLIGRILENSGYKVQYAEDGVDALIRLAQQNFDLIISDIRMPNLDGFKFIEIKNQKNITTPVIFLTSQNTEEDEARALELGAADFISKPIKKEILLLRIKKVLNIK
ncbi:MAG: ATPase, T2SS/T4P/T4SS family [Syntrophorhabdaceae bacterium]|nr:ATPase, T2SS/T4P/T4SS family [Syntrophorhabdaceae bacterium]